MFNSFEINPAKYHKKRSREEGIEHIYDIPYATKEEVRGNLAYTWEYSDGSKVEAVEQSDGEVVVTINKDGKNSLDLKTYLPEGSKIVTPNYKFDDQRVEKPSSRFSALTTANERFVFVNDGILDPKDILAIFHEMGHILIIKTPEERIDYTLGVHGIRGLRNKQKIISKEERAAWLNALQLIRRLKNERGLNILEVCGSFKEFQKYMHYYLTTYRYSGELQLIDGSIRTWLKSFFGPVLKDEDAQLMENLFDKKKLTRRFRKQK